VEGDAEQLFEEETERIISGPSDPGSAAEAAPEWGRFLPNLLSNAAIFGVNIVIGLWYTPYLVHHLGTAAWGLIPLVTQITSYMTVITATLNSATNRYVTIALERNDVEAAKQYFNTTLFGSALALAVLLPPTIWATLDIGRIINVPAGQETQTRWLFLCTAASFFLGTLQSPFNVSCYCRNRFDLLNFVSLIQYVVRVGAVVIFFTFFTPQLWHVGAALVLAALIGWRRLIQLWRRLTPSLTISLSHFSRNALRNLCSTGGWASINYLGTIFYLGIDLLVVNRMFGTEQGGRYGVALQWSSLLRMLVAVIGVLFGPTMLRYYAKHDIAGLCRYGRQAVKMVGLMMALPVGLICGFSAPLLQTWVGPDFVNLDWLMSLMTFHLSFNLAVMPLNSIQVVTNRLRTPALAAIVIGVANLGLAIFLAGPMGWGVYGVAAAGAIALTTKNFIFTSVYAAHVLHRRLDAFVWEAASIVLAALATAGACKLLAAAWDVSGWFHLAAAGAAVSALYAAVGYSVLLSREERVILWGMMPSLKWPKRG
jgi:membrane protein EpsK